MIGVSKTYIETQLMHPLYQAVCNHFLTTTHSFWWGNDRRESVSKQQANIAVAFRDPGVKGQPLHRDDFIHHNMHKEEAAP
jgi:ectoine hydroxylase-related dioxygenase (phytanoyl-CoA dioxygenase family)